MQLTSSELQRLIEGSSLDQRQKNLYGKCPKCGESEFGISLDNNHRFGCFRKRDCGFTGNIFTLLAFLGKSVQDVKPGYEPRTKLINKLLINEATKIDLELIDCSAPVGWRRTYDNAYLNNRGWDAGDYERFEVGTTNIDPRYRDYVIFLIRQFGSVKGTVARSILSKETIESLNAGYKAGGIDKKILRYINSSSDFAKMLVGVEEIGEETNTVILVEGLFDKGNIDKLLDLHRQKDVKCCCTFKCAVSNEQIYLLQQKNVDTIVLLYDPDVIDQIKKAAWELEQYFNVYIGYNRAGNDPGDMKPRELDEVLSGLQSPSQFSISKLNAPRLKKK